MKPLFLLLLALPLHPQTPPKPGKTLDVQEAPRSKAELERARKARARLEALKRARAAELARAYAQEQQRQAALKTAKAPTTGVLVLGGPAPSAPAAPAAPVTSPIHTPRSPEEVLATLRALALPKDPDGARWEVISFDGRTLVLDQTGGNYRKRFRIPLAEVDLKPSQRYIEGAWRDLDAIALESRKWQIPVTTFYTAGEVSEREDHLVILPIRNARAVVELLKRYLAQATAKP